MTTTDRCDEIVRLIDGALADCGGGMSRRRAVARKTCAVQEAPANDTDAGTDGATDGATDGGTDAEQRRHLLDAVDIFLASTYLD